MHWGSTVTLLLFSVATTSAFFFGSGGGCGCQPQPACAPPPQPAPCSGGSIVSGFVPPAPSFGGGHAQPAIGGGYQAAPLSQPPQYQPVQQGNQAAPQQSFQQPGPAPSYQAQPDQQVAQPVAAGGDYQQGPAAQVAPAEVAPSQGSNYEAAQSLQQAEQQVPVTSVGNVETNYQAAAAAAAKVAEVEEIDEELPVDQKRKDEGKTTLKKKTHQPTSAVATTTKIATTTTPAHHTEELVPETNEKEIDISELHLTDDPLCNSDDLRKVVIENIDDQLNSSKRMIQLAAEAQFGGRFDVICANGDFSYVTNTELYCQETKGDISCYTYRQL
ncbi:unnamed protein product [Caenorhabditis bovis]|uniref:Ground-like domain-containing protein n=1 Tax=Caenorhabditis bovis TaxID=2654633 RepID=A0A8S1EBI7_9PELO|nr:unnamed protein product [Caenorhabditis bovis]